MKKFFDKIMLSGIWIQPIVMTGIIKYLQANNPSKTSGTCKYIITQILQAYWKSDAGG